MFGLLRPYLELGVFALPFGYEIPQGFLPRFGAFLLGYAHERVGSLLPVGNPDLGADVLQEVDEASLPSGERIGLGDCLVDAR